MFSVYETEVQPEMRQAEVERDLAGSALVEGAVRVRHAPVRERMALALVALAEWLTLAGEGAVPTDRPVRPLTWS